MTFKDFVEATGYSPLTVSHAFLYRPNKRIKKMAKALDYEPTDEEKTNMRYMISGKKTYTDIYGEAA